MARLVLIPGLGADARLFEPQRPSFPDLEVVPWIEPRRDETLVSYGTRLAEGLPRGKDIVLGGVSFGGMLAWEIASIVKPAAVILVATCTTPNAIPRHNRWLARLAASAPSRLLRPPALARPVIAWAFGAGRPPGRAIIDHCVRTASPEFVKWGLSAILSWQPSPTPPVPIVHVQGATDRLIPASCVKATHVVPGAGHLLNVTHATWLNERLLERIGALLAPAATGP